MIESDEVRARRGALARARDDARRRARRPLRRPARDRRRARAREPPGEGRALETAGRRLRRLQTALRLWDDAEPALGPTAWARTDGNAWMAVPLATGLRRPAGDCLLTPRRRTRCARSAASSSRARPARANSPGRCAASSSAASAAAPSKR